LDYPNDAGVSKKDNLKQVEEQTGERPPELEQPEINPELFPLIETFWICREEKGLSIPAVESYCRMTGEKITAIELRLLKYIDNTVSGYLSKRARKETKTIPPKPAARKGR